MTWDLIAGPEGVKVSGRGHTLLEGSSLSSWDIVNLHEFISGGKLSDVLSGSTRLCSRNIAGFKVQ